MEKVDREADATTDASSSNLRMQPIGTSRRRKAQRGKAGGRTCHKAVWLTEAEETLLAAKSQAAGLSIASFLRASALGDAGPRARRVPTIEKEILGLAIAELNKVGSNVNQIARSSNKGDERDDVLLSDCLAEIRHVLTLFVQAIKT